ncbi:MAG: hypothetical protein AAF489_16125 [Bacteroidota bacterium]
MKTNSLIKAAIVPICIIAILLFAVKDNSETSRSIENQQKLLTTSGAGKSMDAWAYERTYPNDRIPVSKYVAAFEMKKQQEALRSNSMPGEWESLGPENIGGRTLSLAFHPTDPNIIYAGTASGGLWKTTTQGVGREAWEYVPTGFPVLGVGAVAIDQNDPNIIIIGTGESYGSFAVEPGVISRFTRGTYGIGILKTTDGGTTWNQVLSFDEDELKGIRDIAISSQNSSEMYAATTDGIYQSLDGGNTWALIFTGPCFDVEVDPNDGDIIYWTRGNFNLALDPTFSGIYKSTDKGATNNELLDPGLIAAWSGTAKITIDPSDSNTLYASIQMLFVSGGTTPAGVYKSTNGGTSWSKINDQNIAQFQGWYSHDIAVNPADPTEIIYCGIDTYKSTDSGAVFAKESNWTLWAFGEISVDEPEGTDDYVHGDIHAVYYHPLVVDKVFYATDGGVFSSDDGGETFVTHNGGLQTGQFHPNVGSSTTNKNLIIAGAQDNATYIYRGTPSWFRVIGGDGMSAAINPEDDQIIFGSSQNLGIQRSTNGGTTFSNSAPVLVANDATAFLAPYEIAPSNANIMYAGGTYLYRSDDQGTPGSWSTTANQPVDGTNVLTKIAISPTNPDLLFVSANPVPFSGSTETPKVWKSTDGGQNFTVMNGLPERVCKDIDIDPTNNNVVYAVFSGFGTDHIYKTVDGGATWASIDNGLPDLPTNAVLVDPLNPDDIYVGNDVGVYYSEDAGNSWDPFSEALPEATIIMDLNHSPADRKIRIATHGHGVWERSYVNDFLSTSEFEINAANFTMYPNPADGAIAIRIESKVNSANVNLEVLSMLGQKVANIALDGIQNGVNTIPWRHRDTKSRFGSIKRAVVGLAG